MKLTKKASNFQRLGFKKPNLIVSPHKPRQGQDLPPSGVSIFRHFLGDIFALSEEIRCEEEETVVMVVM